MRNLATHLLIAGLLAMGSRYAFAQSAAKAPVGDDLRAAYANAAEIAEGKRLAQSSCAGCHGANGISTTKGIPHLAGQRPAYLHGELRTFKAGGRGENPMAQAVKFLSDDALVKVAAYYGTLEPASPAKGGSPKGADRVQAGKAAAATCAGCHGEGGVSTTPGTPSLAGLDPKYIASATKAYKAGGQRKNDTMAALASTLSDADIANVSLYYALQKPARSKSPLGADPSKGKDAAAACAGCHGEGGVSGNAANPSLAGQDAEYLAAALRGYKQGARGDETMKGLAASLDEPAIKALAAYYASQAPKPAEVRKPLAAAEWAQRCDRCHGVNGNSTDPRIPAIAAQRPEYLEKVLQGYRSGEHKNSQMAAMAQGLGEDDVAALAAYYARQKARSVVYVILPSR